MTLVAQRPLSIGDKVLAPGDIVDAEAQNTLPHGRLHVLMGMGHIKDAADGEGGLAARVVELEARVEALESRRGPGRPRKTEAA